MIFQKKLKGFKDEPVKNYPANVIGPLKKNFDGSAERKRVGPYVGEVVRWVDETGVGRAAVVTMLRLELDSEHVRDSVDLFVIFPNNFMFVHGVSRLSATKGHWDWV